MDSIILPYIKRKGMPRLIADEIEGVEPLKISPEDAYKMKFKNSIFQHHYFLQLDDKERNHHLTMYEEDNKYYVMVLLSYNNLASMVTRWSYDSLEKCALIYNEIKRRGKFTDWYDMNLKVLGDKNDLVN